jgi:ribosomal protein S18 acetylase RimI-like enzyme
MNTSSQRSQFIVREARSKIELAECLRLDHTYVTDHVWQVDVRDDPDDLNVRFRAVRLPRTMDVEYPRDAESLARVWRQQDCFLVAVSDDVILGYVNMRIDANRTRGWINDLVVGRDWRRRGIGSALLEQGLRWASMHRVTQVTLEMQSKNYPAIRFAQTKGFVFCGFNDYYYSNQDIAVLFGKTL